MQTQTQGGWQHPDTKCHETGETSAHSALCPRRLWLLSTFDGDKGFLSQEELRLKGDSQESACGGPVQWKMAMAPCAASEPRGRLLLSQEPDRDPGTRPRAASAHRSHAEAARQQSPAAPGCQYPGWAVRTPRSSPHFPGDLHRMKANETPRQAPRPSHQQWGAPEKQLRPSWGDVAVLRVRGWKGGL